MTKYRFVRSMEMKPSLFYLLVFCLLLVSVRPTLAAEKCGAGKEWKDGRCSLCSIGEYSIGGVNTNCTKCHKDSPITEKLGAISAKECKSF